MSATGTRLAAALAILSCAACGGGDDDGESPPDAGDGDGGSWEVAAQDLPGALFSVWGTSPEDIWAVGSRTGEGPLVLHYDGADWETIDASSLGEVDLWWVFGFAGGPVYVGGSGGTIASFEGGVLTPMTTPSNEVTVFGIWGCSPDDVWAVGGQEGGARGGFAWRRDGDAWIDAEGFPAELAEADVVWKAYGRGCGDVWMIGTKGLALHWDGTAFGEVERVAGSSLFTVHANADRFVAVGGLLTGIVVENDGSGWRDATPGGIDPVFGVCLTQDGGFASGRYGLILARGDGAWAAETTGITLDQSLHSVWIDPGGDVWAAGGQVLSAPYSDGVLIHRSGQ